MAVRPWVIVSLSSIFSSPWALAENRFSLPDLILPEGAKGVSLFVACAHDITVTGYSISIRYDPAALDVTEVTTAGTTAAPEKWVGTHDPVKGEIAFGAIQSLSDPLAASLPPNPAETLARITLDVRAKAPALTAIEFVDGLSVSPLVKNVLTDDKAQSLRSPDLALTSGSVRVFAPPYLPPQARAGGPSSAGEGSVVELDGSSSTSPVGLPLFWRWLQVSGPPAQPLGGLDGPRPRFMVPSVDGDVDLAFDLQVSDGLSTGSAMVRVLAVDLDLRRGTLVAAPGGASIIDGGRRAVVFQGDLRWGTSPEDAEWTGIRFHARGDGDEAKLIQAASLWIDSNGNGSFDPGDAQAGDGAAIPADDAPVSFSLSRRLASGSTLRFFLVVDLAGGAPRPGLLPLAIPLALILGASIALGRRGASRAGLAALVLAVSMPLVPMACGGGGGGGAKAPSGPSREVRFDLLGPDDLTLHGASTGVPATLSGLPITGPPLRV